MKAIALFSGGLDSILAVKLITDQGIEVMGVAFETPFFNALKPLASAKLIGLPLSVKNITAPFLEMLKRPKYGYGKNMNPCIDCHTLMLSAAGGIMRDEGADFIITGEVLGQRPMSQTKQSLHIVAKNSGFREFILRPLSAQLLPITKVENEGEINRAKLLSIQGRGRQRQLAMAREMGITGFPAPAGGCLLTDPVFSRRLRDLMRGNYDLNDIELLKYGRHFRLDEKTKVVVGRNSLDNSAIEKLFKPANVVLQVDGFPGPTTFLIGDCSQDNIRMAASLCVLYSDSPEDKKVKVRLRGTQILEIEAAACDRECARRLMI